MAQPGGKGEKFWEKRRGQGRVERKIKKEGKEKQGRKWSAVRNGSVRSAGARGSTNWGANLSQSSFLREHPHPHHS